MPGQFDRPKGCLFSPRCAFVFERCRREAPAHAAPQGQYRSQHPQAHPSGHPMPYGGSVPPQPYGSQHPGPVNAHGPTSVHPAVAPAMGSGYPPPGYPPR